MHRREGKEKVTEKKPVRSKLKITTEDNGTGSRYQLYYWTKEGIEFAGK